MWRHNGSCCKLQKYSCIPAAVFKVDTSKSPSLIVVSFAVVVYPRQRNVQLNRSCGRSAPHSCTRPLLRLAAPRLHNGDLEKLNKRWSLKCSKVPFPSVDEIHKQIKDGRRNGDEIRVILTRTEFPLNEVPNSRYCNPFCTFYTFTQKDGARLIRTGVTESFCGFITKKFDFCW